MLETLLTTPDSWGTSVGQKHVTTLPSLNGTKDKSRTWTLPSFQIGNVRLMYF